MVNVTCVAKKSDTGESNYVAHITYASKLSKLGIDPGEIDLEATLVKVNQREAESQVFAEVLIHDPFLWEGDCNSEELLNINKTQMIEQTWHITSRMEMECREEILQVYCAYFLQPKGTCVPPDFLSSLYPSKGRRPINLWRTLETWQKSPSKVRNLLLF